MHSTNTLQNSSRIDLYDALAVTRVRYVRYISLRYVSVRYGTALVRPPNGHQRRLKWLPGHPQRWCRPPSATGGHRRRLTEPTGRRGHEAVGTAAEHVAAAMQQYRRRSRRLRRLSRVGGVEGDGRQRVVVVEFCSCTRMRITHGERSSGGMRHGCMGERACSPPHGSGHSRCHAHWSQSGSKILHQQAALRPTALMASLAEANCETSA